MLMVGFTIKLILPFCCSSMNPFSNWFVDCIAFIFDDFYVCLVALLWVFLPFKQLGLWTVLLKCWKFLLLAYLPCC